MKAASLFVPPSVDRRARRVAGRGTLAYTGLPRAAPGRKGFCWVHWTFSWGLSGKSDTFRTNPFLY